MADSPTVLVNLLTAVSWSSRPLTSAVSNSVGSKTDDQIVLLQQGSVIGHPGDLQRALRIRGRRERRGLLGLQVALRGHATGEVDRLHNIDRDGIVGAMTGQKRDKRQRNESQRRRSRFTRTDGPLLRSRVVVGSGAAV